MIGVALIVALYGAVYCGLTLLMEEETHELNVSNKNTPCGTESVVSFSSNFSSLLGQFVKTFGQEATHLPLDVRLAFSRGQNVVITSPGAPDEAPLIERAA